MSRTIQKKIKFSKGQVSPELIERTDLSFYDSSAQKLKNFISTIYGGVRSRLGTKYIDYITDIDEATPVSITSTVFGSTTHFTDTTTVTSSAIGNNKLFAQIDYGVDSVGSCKIEIKKIKVNPYIVEYKTAGTHSLTLEKGTYKIDLVGGGGGGANTYGTDGTYWYYATQAGGGGGYVYGKKKVNAGTYSIVVGSGGTGKNTASYNWQDAGNGGNTSAFSEVAYGGKGGSATPTNYRYGTGGGGSTTLSKKTGNAGGHAKGVGLSGSASGGTSKYNSTYGKGGNNYSNGKAGYARIELYQPSYNLIFYGSSNGTDWTELATKNISTTEYDLSFVVNYRYRYIKVVIDTDQTLQSSLSFQYIRMDISNSDKDLVPVKMHKFIYNNEDRYLFVFVKEKVQVFKNDELVQIVTATGLLEDYVRDAKVAYKDDTVIVTHPLMPPKQLQRQSNGTWTWSDFTIKNTPYYLFGSESTTTKSVSITPSALEGTVKITAASSVFDSNYVGQYIDGNGGRVRITEYTSATVVKGYTIIPFYTTDAITSWSYISGYEKVWSSTRGYPTTCLFAQQRLWFGGSKSLPSHIWASRLDDYNNFKNSGNYDNDSIDVTLLTNNRIMNMIEQRGIHILTSGDEWTIQEGTYTPDAISITKNTANGSIDVTPAIVSGAVLFVEKNGKSLLSYVYNYDQASFLTENISLFSSLIKAPVAFDTEVNSSRDKSDFIYLVLADGTMLCGCLLLDQNVTSISEYVTSGKVKDVCCILEEVYLLISRNGTICLEKINDVPTDCTMEELITTNEVGDLYKFDGKYVYVWSDTKNYGKYLVVDNKIVLDEIPNELCKIGLVYDYLLESNPIAINGKTTSIKKRISHAVLTCKDTDRLEFNGQKKFIKGNVFDFYSCTKYENDVRFKVQGEFYPIEILSIMLNINYEG